MLLSGNVTDGVAFVLAIAGDVLVGLAKLIGLVRSSGATTWTVGVLRTNKSSGLERVVWREDLEAGADEVGRVAEIAETIRAGTLDVTSRWARRRTL